MTQSIANLPIGSKIKFGRYQVEAEEPQQIIWLVADKNHAGYPSGSVTLLTDKIIDLRAFDAKEANNSNADRKNYGNNRYSVSNMLQWLNSRAVSTWYTNQHGQDAPPTNADTNNYGTGYDDRPGFLANFSDDEYAALLDTRLTVAKNTVTDGGGTEIVTSKVFLLSTTEVGLADEISGSPEGSKLALFSDNNSRIATLTPQCLDNTLSTNKPSTVTDAWYWWLRTPYASRASLVRYVASSGTLSSSSAYFGYCGLRPALNLTSAISVSDTTDSDGCYIVYERKAPVIDGRDGDLGTKFGPFDVPYVVTDTPENDIVTVTEAINGSVIKNYVPILGQVNKANITNEILTTLDNGVPATLTITATDDDGATARSYTFIPWRYSANKTKVSVQLGQPIKTDYAVNRIAMTIQVTKEVDAIVTVKACNNAYDAEPTWEDITTAIMNKKAASLQNAIKTAQNWGLNVQIDIQKAQQAGVISIDSFALSFE